MLDIDEMSSKEIHELLQKSSYGHLGCVHEGKPYVMPMHYCLEASDIYLFTTEGMKTHDLDVNPEVCLQVEELHDPLHWRSVIVNGRADRLTEQPDLGRLMRLIKEQHPTFSPAISRTWIDAQGHSEAIVIYRVQVVEMSGRTTDGISSQQKA